LRRRRQPHCCFSYQWREHSVCAHNDVHHLFLPALESDADPPTFSPAVVLILEGEDLISVKDGGGNAVAEEGEEEGAAEEEEVTLLQGSPGLG